MKWLIKKLLPTIFLNYTDEIIGILSVVFKKELEKLKGSKLYNFFKDPKTYSRIKAGFDFYQKWYFERNGVNRD